MDRVRFRLLDLPLELVRLILRHAIAVRGIERGVRLRLVNRLFSEQIPKLICIHGMIPGSDILGLQRSKFFTISYMVPRIMDDSDQGEPVRICIRKVAERLAPKASDVRHYVTSLVTLVVERQDYEPILVRIQPWKTPTKEQFEEHVQAAAVYMDHVLDVEKWGAPRTTSSLFGSCPALAARFGSREMIELYLAGQITANRCEMLPHASREGRVDMVRLIFNYAAETVPWRFSRDKRIKIEHAALMRALKTPSPEIWEFLMEVHKKYQVAPRRAQENRVFVYCCKNNWVAMARHLAPRPANTSNRSLGYAADRIDDATLCGHTEILQVLFERRPSKICNRWMKQVASSGNLESMRLLLSHDKTRTPGAVVAAARRGHKDVVELLLKNGGNANEDYRGKPAIVYAILQEHKRMFESLMAHGAVLPKGTMREDVLNTYRPSGPDSVLAPFLQVLQNSQSLADVEWQKALLYDY